MGKGPLGCSVGGRPARIPDLAAFVDHCGGGPEVFGGELTHQPHRLPLRIRSRTVLWKLKHRCEARATKRTTAGELQLQYSRDAERARQVKSAIGHEVAQRVRDQAAPVELHSSQHVRAMTDNGIGTGIDHRTGPSSKVAARLSPE